VQGWLFRAVAAALNFQDAQICSATQGGTRQDALKPNAFPQRSTLNAPGPKPSCGLLSGQRAISKQALKSPKASRRSSDNAQMACVLLFGSRSVVVM